MTESLFRRDNLDLIYVADCTIFMLTTTDFLLIHGTESAKSTDNSLSVRFRLTELFQFSKVYDVNGGKGVSGEVVNVGKS